MQERKDPWTVGAWMTANPQTISADISVRDAFFKMRSEGIRHLPVVEEGKLVGMVTDRDLRRPDISNEPDGWHDYYNRAEDYEVRHVMTTRVKSTMPSEGLEKVLDLILDHRFGALPVVDKTGSMIGIITTYDLLLAFQKAMSQVGDILRHRMAR